MQLSEGVQYLISLLVFFFFWLPLMVFLVLLVVNVIYCEIQSAQLEKDYRRKLSDYDKKVIEDYKENTNYVRYKRRLRRIKKNLIDKK